MSDLLRLLWRSFQRDLSRGALDEAEATLLRMDEEAPLAVETRGSRVELLMRQGRAKEAAPLLAALLEQHPASARIQLLAGRHRYARREYDEALEHFRESHRRAPSPSLERWIGKTLTQLGRFDDAEATLERLAEAGHDVVSELAWLAERRGEIDRALRLLDKKPGDEFAAAQRMRLEAKRLEPEAMLEEIETMKALGDEIPEALLPDLVRNLLRTGRTEDAQRLLAGIDPIAPKLAGNLAWACYEQFKYDLAFDLFVKGLPANATYVKYFPAMEKAAEKCARLEELIEVYERAADRDPTFHGRAKRARKRLRRLESSRGD